MDNIPESHLKLAKLWLELIAKFMNNQKIVRYLMENKYDLIKILLIFLSKAHLTIKNQNLGKKFVLSKVF